MHPRDPWCSRLPDHRGRARGTARRIAALRCEGRGDHVFRGRKAILQIRSQTSGASCVGLDSRRRSDCSRGGWTSAESKARAMGKRANVGSAIKLVPEIRTLTHVLWETKGDELSSIEPGRAIRPLSEKEVDSCASASVGISRAAWPFFAIHFAHTVPLRPTRQTRTACAAVPATKRHPRTQRKPQVR